MQDVDLLKVKTVYGFFWSFADLVSKYGLQIVTQIFLARLLSPEDFGIIGIITVFIVISQSFIDSGFASALIREEKSTQNDYSTVFYFNLIMALLLYLLIYTFADEVSIFFREPKLTYLLRVLSLVLIINSFGLIQRTMLIKKMDFKIQTQISIISSIVSGIVAIICAKSGYGVWSLVIQILLMQFSQSLLLSISNRWMPSLVFSVDSFKRLFNFGWKLLVSSIINVFYQNIFYVIIGKSFSAIELGYYTNAQKLRDMASQSITASVQKVSYPALSSIKSDQYKLKIGYKKIIKNAVFITFPIMIGLAAVSDSLIKVLFGESWVESISYFQILCFAGMLFPLHAINLNILKVKGRSDLFLKLEVLKKIIGVMFIVIVLYFKLGIMGLLWTAVINSYVAYVINSYYSGELISYSAEEQIKDIATIFFISIIMGIIVYFSKFMLPENDIIRLLLQIIIGVISYTLISYIAKLEELDTVYNLMKYILNKMNSKIRNSKGV